MIPTAAEVEREINAWELCGIGPATDKTKEYLRFLAAILVQADMKDIDAACKNGVRVQSSSGDTTIYINSDLARRFAARIGVLEAEREHWKSEVAIGHEINAKLTAERDLIEAETVERCAKAKGSRDHKHYADSPEYIYAYQDGVADTQQEVAAIRALPPTRKEG